MNKKQQHIHNGLLKIGKEIASLYAGGLEILQSSIEAKSYFLGHCLREIEGSLRNIFEDKKLKKQLHDDLTEDQLMALYKEFTEEYEEFDYLKGITFEEFKKAKAHIASITASFGLNLDSNIIKKYIKLARYLHKYAHRSGAFNPPRNPSDAVKIWSEFEEVLYQLIGNYYALSARLDTIIAMEVPTDESVATLKNLLTTKTNYFYFFKNLKNPNWLPILHENGYFNGDLNPERIISEEHPGSFTTPVWAIMIYLEKVAEFNQQNPNEEVSQRLVHIVDEIYNHKKDDGSRIKNYYTDNSIISIISRLPKEFLSDEHFKIVEELISENNYDMHGYQFDSFFSQLLDTDDNILILKGVNLLFSFRETSEFSFEPFESTLPDYELKRILDLRNKDIIDKLGFDYLNYLIDLIDRLVKINSTAFDKHTIPTIENHNQTFNPEKLENQIIYALRDILINMPSGELIPIISTFLNNDHPIFKRLAIYVLNNRYDETKEILWKMDKNPLQFNGVKHEMYELLNQNGSKFDDGEIKQILSWIEHEDYHVSDRFKDDKEKKEKLIAYQKKEWLTSVLHTENEMILKRFEELNQQNETEVTHPGFDSWHESQSGNISPIDINDLMIMSFPEIKDYFEKFKEEPSNFMGPSIEGLTDSLSIAIEESPEKFEPESHHIIDAIPEIKYAWIKGLQNAWTKTKDLDVQTSILTILEIVKSPQFWKEYNENNSHLHWFISQVISFLEKGLENDNKAFDPSLLPSIKEILLEITNQDKKEVFDYQDLSMSVLNNSKGKVYTSLIQFCLRKARLEDKEENRWDPEIKDFFDEKVNQKDEDLLLHFAMGQFLPQLAYLDLEWLKQNFNVIFPIGDESKLNSSLKGYLFYNQLPNKMFFELFQKEEIFKKAIENPNLDQNTTKGLVKQILVAYLNNFDDCGLESEIVATLINSDNPAVYTNLINFLYGQNSVFKDDQKTLIKSLWIKVFKHRISLTNPETDKLILSGSCLWTNIVPLDDEIVEVVISSLPYIEGRDYSLLINILSKKVDAFPKQVGFILSHLFKHRLEYTHYRNELVSTVSKLYANGEKDLADEICILYAEKGFDDLRGIYFENNN